VNWIVELIMAIFLTIKKTKQKMEHIEYSLSEEKGIWSIYFFE